MILDDLNDYYLLKSQEEGSDMPRRFWGEEKVAWEFRLDREGRLHEPLSYEDEGAGVRNRALIVPEHSSRSSGVKPFFLCDKAAYLLGRDAKRGAEMLARTRELHHVVLDGVDDDAARAVLAFLDSQAGVEDLPANLLEELDKGANIVFRYIPTGRLAHEVEAVRSAWVAYNESQASDGGVQCSVTGRLGVPAMLFPQVSGFPGAQSAGASLVSFNQDSFCSYGKTAKDQALNASLSTEAAFNIGSALKYLVKQEGHRVSFGNGQMLFWTEAAKPEDEEFLAFGLDLDGFMARAREDEGLRSQLHAALEGIRAGRKTMPFDRSTRYFILGLAPNAARLSVRFFETGTLGNLERNLQSFLRDTEIVDWNGGRSAEPRSIRFYVYQTAAFGEARNVPDTLLGSVTGSVLNGTPFPMAFFQLLLARTRVDKGRSGSGGRKYDAMTYRAAAMKACLLRRNPDLERSLTVSLNEDNHAIGYLLGRLFAVLEKAQTDAVPGANATIRDRYMGSASTTPARVFPQLLGLAEHHISKSEYGRLSDERIRGIMANIDEFPRTLGYDDQGQFFIGYYHQKAEIFRKKGTDDRAAAEGEE